MVANIRSTARSSFSNGMIKSSRRVARGGNLLRKEVMIGHLALPRDCSVALLIFITREDF